MPNSLLLAPMSPAADVVMGEFYIAFADVSNEHGFELTGVSLFREAAPSITIPAALPAKSYRWSSPKKKVYALLRKGACRKLWSYAAMQASAQKNLTVKEAFFSLTKFEKMLRNYLVEHQIQHVLLNHNFTGYQLICKDLCDELGIPYHFWHPGLLPGTMCYDCDGQMAESEINHTPQLLGGEFSSEDYQIGRDYLDWAKSASFRRPGKKTAGDASEFDVIRSWAEESKKPVLLVLGANDYRAGVAPRTYANAKVHSPVYESSADLLRSVVDVCGDAYAILYKPHPNVGLNGDFPPESVQIVYDVLVQDLLSIANASVTLVSSSAFESLLKGVPCVLAGHLPGSRLDCFYRAQESKDELKPAIEHALENGFTDEMQKLFTGYCGYMLQNYFFSFGRYAYPQACRGIEDATKEILPQGVQASADDG